MMKKTALLVALLAVLASSAAVAASRPALTLPVEGTFIDPTGGNGTFSGTFKLIEFGVQNNVLVARGYVVGTMTNSLGQTLASVAKPVSWPVEVSSGAAAGGGRVSSSAIQPMATCPILHLDLGPLNIDLLGLTVDLSRVILDIAAETGAGNLLGNLLCAVVSLLDGPGNLLNLADLLNRILDVLSGILG